MAHANASEESGTGAPAQSRPAIPAALLEVVQRLADDGHATWLTGEDLHRRWRGWGSGTPELWTTAPRARILERFEQAVPIRPDAAVIALPTRDGPVDLVSHPSMSALTAGLMARDFTIHAAAFDPVSGERMDPADGDADWARRRLRCVGKAAERLAEAPERVWRALRCASEYDLEVDEDLESTLAPAAPGLRPGRALAARRELQRWLDLDDPGTGARIAWRSGLTRALAPGADERGARLIGAVPAEPRWRRALRLAIWLHGAAAAPLLRQLRVGEPLSSAVLRLASLHPIDRAVRPGHEAAVSRLERRALPGEMDALVAWRRAEIAAGLAEEGAAKRLETLVATLDRTARHRERQRRQRSLAIDGAAVMEVLGDGPGPHVGRAIAALAEWAGDDPERNQPGPLREALRAWQRSGRADG